MSVRDARCCHLVRKGFTAALLSCAVGAMAQSLPDVIWGVQTHSYYVSPVAISPNGALVASPVASTGIRLSNLTNGAFVRSLNGHTAGVASLAFSPDATMLASTADDRTLRVWDVATGAQIRSITQGGGNVQFTSVAFHPDGQHVLSDWARTNVVMWSITNGLPVWETRGNSSQIQSVTVSPDGSLVAVAGGFRGQDINIRIIRALDGQLLQTLVTSNAYGVRQLAFSSNGQWLAAGCYEDTSEAGGVELWRVADWTRERILPVRAPVVAFSSDDKYLTTLRNQAMDCWRIPEGTLACTFGPPTNGNYGSHLCLAISRGDERIVTGNYKFIDTPNGTLTAAWTLAYRYPVLLDLSFIGGMSTLRWTGGRAPFQVQQRSLGSLTWSDLGAPTTNHSLAIPLNQAGGLFRVVAAP